MRLTNDNKLQEVAYKLSITSYTVDGALNEARGSVSNAAQQIFNSWLLEQKNRQEAY